MPLKKKDRVVVAMSGGVDSSTAAANLKAEGHEVVGLTMRLWDQKGEGGGGSRSCCSPDDVREARRVADQIGIPHYVINLKEAFEEEVIGNFVSEYLRGRTPNPCIHCNDRIKFGRLLRKTEELGARALATGHYARIMRDAKSGKYRLLRGIDAGKDQSYFLFTLTQGQMAKVLFPLGEKTKSEVREQARELGLRVAGKSESQEICFIPDNEYPRFLEERMGKEIFQKGEIVDRRGKVLGFHRGIHSFTIGQRRGLGIAAPHPFYVLALDCARNRVIAGEKEELRAEGLIATEVNWISSPPERGMEAMVQIRSRHAGAPAYISALPEGRARVRFQNPQYSVTPGQAAVFYLEDEVVGGGWIEKAL